MLPEKNYYIVLTTTNNLKISSCSFKEATELLEQTKLNAKINHRQIVLVEHALKNPGSIYHFKEHQNLHKVTYQTARTDMLELADDFGLLIKVKSGKSYTFLAPADLKTRISSMKS